MSEPDQATSDSEIQHKAQGSTSDGVADTENSERMSSNPMSDTNNLIDTMAQDKSPPTFTEQVSSYQAELEEQFNIFVENLSNRQTGQGLEDLDWNELQERYNDEMAAKVSAEQDVMNDVSAHLQQFMLWMQVSNERESERALKRLRTRITHVQGSEVQLNSKQDHYAKVLEAFQNAVAMLGNL